MRDELKTKKQFMKELYELRGRVIELEGVEVRHGQAEEALLESEERYRNLFANMPVGLYRTTPAGEWLDGNTASARMLGYPDCESMFKANPLADYVNPEERERSKAILEKNGVFWDFESQLRRQDERIIWVNK